MNLLSKQDMEEIRIWMYRSARPLDFARWQYHFESGSKDAVLDRLSAYQNKDGGFGHALDCDNWNPNSTPYNAGQAFGVLQELDIYDPQLPMVRKIMDYLEYTPFLSANGWPFTIPSNDDYPHAPWWNYSEENNIQNGFHATGSLVGYILRCRDTNSNLYQKALAIADLMIDSIDKKEGLEDHEVMIYGVLLNAIKASHLEGRFNVKLLEESLLNLVHTLIQRDLNNWSNYSMMPSNFIDSPDSIFYEHNKEAMEKELDMIINTRPPEGVWDITWQWSGYPNEFAISRRWWQGTDAVKKLLLLRSFNLLP